MATIKRGATLKVTLELTDTEWAAVYPWQSIRAEAQQGLVEHDFQITVDAPNRTILLTLPTQPMALGQWAFDVRVEKSSGESAFLPPDKLFAFTLIEGVTE